MAENAPIAAIRQPEAGTTAPLRSTEPGFPVIDITAQELEELRAQNAALRAKVERRNEITEVVTEAMMAERRKAFGKPSAPEQFVMPQPNGEKLHKITLDRHYRPDGYYEVVGWHKEEVVKKRADGTTIITEPAEFIPGVVKPHHIGGVGFPTKIWAGTVLMIQETEAKRMRKLGIGSIEID